MRITTIKETLESRKYLKETRAKRELFGEISDLFNTATAYPEVKIKVKNIGSSLTSFGKYSPEIEYEQRDPKDFATEPMSGLLADILKQDKLQLVSVYTAHDEVIIRGPTDYVRRVYTKWIESN